MNFLKLAESWEAKAKELKGSGCTPSQFRDHRARAEELENCAHELRSAILSHGERVK